MNHTITMDRSGRVVIPLAVRERYDLADGACRLDLVESDDGIVLRPKAEEIPAERHATGWVVFHSPGKDETDPAQAVEKERERRSRTVEGHG